MNKTFEPTQAFNIENIFFIDEAMAIVATINAAMELGVIKRLEEGDTGSQNLARDCQITERGARALLFALAGLGLVKMNANGTWSSIRGLSQLVTRGNPWDKLNEVLQNDRSIGACDTNEGSATVYPEIVQFLGLRFAKAAGIAAGHLMSLGQAVLDIGAGAAPWSIAVAQADPSCYVTAIDLPEVIPSTQQAVTVAGLDKQFSFIGADFFNIDLGKRKYDLAFVGNICHLFDDNMNRRLLRRLFDVLKPGGKLGIVDALPNENLDGPRSVGLYALGLLLRTSTGQAYPFSTYARWLYNVGFESIQRFELMDDGSLSLITAHRPDL